MQGVWALSGGIASGKSTVAAHIEARGGIVIDADHIAREVVEPGTDGLREIVETFGDNILTAQGELNREALGARIFEDDEARNTLNQILHPKILLRSIERIQEAHATNRRPILDRKSTRLNSSHVAISYAVFCLKKKKTQRQQTTG